MIPVTLVNKTGAGAIPRRARGRHTGHRDLRFQLPGRQPAVRKDHRSGQHRQGHPLHLARHHPADGFLKPDVGAPRLHTSSANSGTGNEGLDESGTLMATPHTAGNAALVKSAHPA